MYNGVPQTVSTYSPGRTVLTLYARQKRCQVSKSSNIKINKLSYTSYSSPLTDTHYLERPKSAIFSTASAPWLDSKIF